MKFILPRLRLLFQFKKVIVVSSFAHATSSKFFCHHKLWPWEKFLALREVYRANSQVVFNRENRLWESFLLKRPQSAHCRIISWFLEILSTVSQNFRQFFLRKFANFLEFLATKFEMKSPTERTGCYNGSYRSGGSLIFFKRNVIALGKCLVF